MSRCHTRRAATVWSTGGSICDSCKRATQRNLMPPLIYLIALGISFFSAAASLVCFVIVPIFYVFPGRIDWCWTYKHIHEIDEFRVLPDPDVCLSGDEESS